MSDGEHTSAWQHEHVAGSFAERRRRLIPLLDVQEELVRTLLRRGARSVERFVDLGCGDGAMGAVVFEVFPAAHGVLVDFSEPMLERAHARFAQADCSVEFRVADLATSAWAAELGDGGFDAIVSGFAIHHLTGAAKRALFDEVALLLAPGGQFVNVDIVETEGPLDGLFFEYMETQAQQAGESIEFDGDEDLPDPVGDQLAWLEAAGLEQVEVHFKWAEAAVLGAVKPL